MYLIDLIGVAVFAVSGVIAADRKRADVLGVLVVGALTAVGGGTFRDLLLARHPVFWMADPRYLAVVLVVTVLTLAYVRYRRVPDNALAITDAVGLGIFTISGAQMAERAGTPTLLVVLMATMTGAASGVLRDVLTAEVPLILRRGNVYATASVLGCGIYLSMKWLGVGESPAALTGIAVVIVLRLAAILRS